MSDVSSVARPAATALPPDATVPRRSDWVEIRCNRCGYGAVAAHTIDRCPMCGANAWLIVRELSLDARVEPMNGRPAGPADGDGEPPAYPRDDRRATQGDPRSTT